MSATRVPRRVRDNRILCIVYRMRREMKIFNDSMADVSTRKTDGEKNKSDVNCEYMCPCSYGEQFKLCCIFCTVAEAPMCVHDGTTLYLYVHVIS